MEPKKYILLPNEVEGYVEAIEMFDIETVGSPRWLSQHKKIFKLSMQAVMNVMSEEEEIVKESLLLSSKTPILIHELILTEIWKKKVFPEIQKLQLPSSSHAHLYAVLFHEASIVTFLEAVMFHQEVTDSADDVLLDLIDYCHRNIPYLTERSPTSEKITRESIKSCNAEDLQKANNALAFEIGIKAVSILSCLAQNINNIPLCVLHRLLNVHDTPLLFVNLISEMPWERRLENGEVEAYIDGKWQKTDIHKVSKMEGQLWISLFKLLLDSECQKKYHFNEFRKEQVMKLKSKINEVIIDQIPILHEMLCFLEHLSVFAPPPAKSDIVIEQVSEIWDLLMKENKGKWKSIAKIQSQKVFSNTDEQCDAIIKELSATYDMDDLEAVLSVPSKCANCGSRAEKRCSQCRNEWYCCRQCQVAHWKRHKPACLLMVKQDTVVNI